MEDILKMKKPELLAKCKELGITKYSAKNKSELIELINKKKLENNVIENNVIENNVIENNVIENNTIENNTIENNTIENNAIKLKFIDLFCGIGGFHQALNKLGAVCVLACDIDKDCRVVYKDNYGIEPISNIKDINEKTMPDFDILTAGFPCQSFSNGGKKKCFNDVILLILHLIT